MTVVKIVGLLLDFRVYYYRFDPMARTIWFIFTITCCFSTTQPALSQISQKAAVNLDSAISLTTTMLNLKMFDQAKVRIDSLMNLISEQKSQNDLLNQLKIRSLLGKYLLQKQKNEGWPELYQWCKNQEAQCQSEEELNLLVRLFNNAGIAFKRLGRLSDSEEAFLKSTEILRKLKNPDYSLYGSVYANAGNSLKQIGEFDRSIEYLKQSIKYFDEFVEKSDSPNAIIKIAEPKSKALNNLGLVYQCLSDHKTAIEVFRTCIDLKLKYFPKDIIEVYGNLVISLIEVENFKEARIVIDKILDNYPSGVTLDRSWALAKLNYTDIDLRITKDTTRILRELNLLDERIRKEIPSALDITIIVNQLITNILLQQGKYLAALNKWSEAMNSISSANQFFSPVEIPFNIITLKFNKLIELMNLNAKVFYDWGHQDDDDLDKLRSAEERYSFSVKFIDSLRNSLELQSSKLQVSRMQRSTYDLLIELEYYIFKLTGDTIYLTKLFTTMEQSKSAALWSSVRDIEFKTSLIPQIEIEKEANIRKKIADIQGRLIEADAAQNTDPKRIRELQQENTVYNLQIDSLKRIFQQKYPDYYRAKFDRSTILLGQVGPRLTPNQVLIEYSIADEKLYTLIVSKEISTIIRTPITQKSSEDIEYILKFMKGNVESFTSSARNHYCEAASGLYELLLGPVESLTAGKELLIIPDGALSYIPFEALLEPSAVSRQDYRKLPYLVRSHSISYGLTATVFFYQSSPVPHPTSSVLAVAPSYKLSTGKISEFIRKAEAGLPELKGTYQESRAIKRMLGGRLLIGARATESTFKRIAPKYGILHLAMHTIPDKNNSLNSGLVFTPGADNKEDGVLFGYEVYNLSLNAWLTVLSACETGTGQMASGEGVLSFGRAFIVAGCPNLVMTMWTVDDRSSQEIMVAFYKSLLSGEGIADALQISKLEYLEHVDQLHAHPFYWAGFIELGQNQVLKISPKKPGLLYLLIFFSFTIIVLVYIQVKKNPRRGRDIRKME